MPLCTPEAFATCSPAGAIRHLPRCGRGGIGRRAALRSLWGNPWKFESSRPHQRKPASAGFLVFIPILSATVSHVGTMRGTSVRSIAPSASFRLQFVRITPRRRVPRAQLPRLPALHPGSSVRSPAQQLNPAKPTATGKPSPGPRR